VLLQDALTQILEALAEEGAPGALLGGLAVSAWTEPRFTRDVDLAVAVASDEDAERLIHRLQGRGYSLLATVEQTDVARLATARLLPPGQVEEGMVVDLLFASSGIEPEIVSAALDLEVGGAVPAKVACIGHLVALKLLAHDPIKRPQDGLDLRALRSVLNDEEQARAARACELIESRGFSRGRDLRGALAAYLSDEGH
jgi:predicted nucleotidyltransferase